MTVFDAPQVDARRERRRRIFLISIVVVIVLGAVLAWQFRHWKQERQVTRFFQALQDKDFDTAYGIWLNDPNWKQHPQQHSRYPFNEFYRDWGPGGEWGVIRSFDIEGSRGVGTGVVVVVTVNERTEKARLWAEKTDGTLTFSPY